MERFLGQLGRVSQRCREVSWQEAQESYCEILNSLADQYKPAKDSVLVNTKPSDLVGFTGGDEHILIQIAEVSDPLLEIPFVSRIYKITHSECFGCGVIFDPEDRELSGKNFHAQGNFDPWLYIKRWQLLNLICSYTTKFEAIIKPERPGWPPRICVSQPYIEGDAPSQTEISESLGKYGFDEVSLGAYYSLDRDILLTDAFPRNVRNWKGIPVPFDAIAINPDEEMKQWMIAKLFAKNSK